MGANYWPKEWQHVKLGDLGEVNRGRSRHRPRYAEHLYGGPYPFIQTGDIKASRGKITTYQQTYSAAGLAQSRLWPTGTMCITIAANIAETGILTFPACFPDSVIGFIPDNLKCDVRFIEYTFRYLKRRIQHEATGSVQDNINLATLDRLWFPLPPLPEQKAITHILGTLDDKIELNQQMNQNLEAIARAIFKSWFVDFDPVRIKMECRQPVGMDAATAALFPDSFEQLPLGEIPKGWQVVLLPEVAEVIDCLHSKKPSDVGQGKLLLQVWNIADAGKLDLSKKYLISEEEYKMWTSRIEVQEGDCVITNVGRVGAVAQIPQDVRAAIGRNMTAIRCKPGCLTPTYVVEYLLSPAMRAEIDLNTDSGTILDSLNVKGIEQLRLVIPPTPIMNAFEYKARPLRRRIELNIEESNSLIGIRNALLPKLMLGEIRVKEAEKILEDVA